MDTDRLWTKNYILLIVASFGTAMLVALFFNTLPLYAERLSGAATYAGLVTTAYSIAALATRPVVGVMATRYSRVKLMLIGIILMTIACYCYTYATVIFFLIALRVVQGIGFGIKSTASGVLAAEIIPPSRFAEGIGMYGLYIPVANAIGPAVGLWVVGSAGMAGFHKLFIIAGVIGIVSFIIMMFVRPAPPDSDTETGAKNEIGKEDLPKTIFGFEFGVVYPSIVLMLMYFGHSAVTTFVPIFAMSKGWTGVGFFYTISAISLFTARLFYSKMAKRYGFHKFTIGSLILFSGALFVIPFLQSQSQLYILACFYGAAQGIVPMVINTQVLMRCSVQRRGTAIASYTSSMDIGIGLGAIVLGIVADAMGYSTTFIIAGLASVFSLIVYCTTIMRDEEKYSKYIVC